MSNLFASQELPRKRTGGTLAWLDRQSIGKIAIMGISLYFFVILSVSLIEFSYHSNGRDLVLNENKVGVGSFSDLLYFNLITILTVGYGDLHPVSYGKLFSVIEAFIGVGLFSLLVAVITVKALLPPRNTVVFSKYAYYCTEPERFLAVFVNTSNTNLGNAEISSYFKLGGDWGVKPSITAPFITQSVQTFYIEHMPAKEIISDLRDGDGLRVGIAGGIGFTSFSASIQYHADEILVIPNRKELVDFFEPKWNPDFTSTSFKRMFHYRPENALTLKTHVERERRPGSQGI
jgi:hypothetical protein